MRSCKTNAFAEGQTHIEPLAVRIPEATRISGISRSEIYRRAGLGEIVLLKAGFSTLVQVDSLRKCVAALPQAEIRSPAVKSAA